MIYVRGRQYKYILLEIDFEVVPSWWKTQSFEERANANNSSNCTKKLNILLWNENENREKKRREQKRVYSRLPQTSAFL